MFLKNWLIIIFCCIPSLSCDDNQSQHNYIIIGSFNIAWLGDGIKDKIPREEIDYQNIADVIRETKADVLALQEIENEAAINKLTTYLPGMKSYILPQSDNQNLAVICKSHIEILSYYHYPSLEVEPDRTRPGMIIEAKSGNFDWIMMIVHLKSTSRYDNTGQLRQESMSIRERQAFSLSNWADSMLAHSEEKDIMIIGDFNDSPLDINNNTLLPLVDNENLIFITEKLKSCKYQHLKSIDHLVISKSLAERYEPNSVRMYNFYDSMPDHFIDNISDHCPVLATFNIMIQDND